MKISIFETVSFVVEEARRKFDKSCEFSEKDYGILEQCCEIIDEMTEECEKRSVRSQVNEDSRTIEVELQCLGDFGYVVQMNPERIKRICGMLKNAITFTTAQVDEDVILLRFVFPTLWQEKM